MDWPIPDECSLLYQVSRDVISEGWFSLVHKHNISITSENTHDISVSISRNIRRTNPVICLMLFSLVHKHKHKHLSISISARKTSMFVFLVLMLMLVRKWEQHQTNKWVCPSAYAYAYVTGVLTWLCLCLWLCVCASENQPWHLIHMRKTEIEISSTRISRVWWLWVVWWLVPYL